MHAIQDATEGSLQSASPVLMRHVASEMLAETLSLMECVENAAEYRNAEGMVVSSAVLLRLSSRLAAIGGWILTLEEQGCEAHHAARRAWSSEMLERAAIGPLESVAAPAELGIAMRRIDALAARALRLNGWINQSWDQASPSDLRA